MCVAVVLPGCAGNGAAQLNSELDPTAGDDVDHRFTEEREIGFKHSPTEFSVVLEKVEGEGTIQPNPILYRKPHSPGPFPVICFLPGGAGTSAQVTLEEFEGQFAEHTRAEFFARGYMVVGIYVKAYGQGGSSMQSTVPFRECLLTIEHLKKLPFVDPNSIVFFGGSGGGNVAMGAASMSKDLACIVVGEPATVIMTGLLENFENRKSREFEQRMKNPHSFYTADNQKKTEALLSNIHCPILIAHSDIHPVRHVNFEIIVPALKRLGKNFTIKMYPGLPHGFYWKSLAPSLVDDVDSFIQQHIQTMPEPL